MPATFDQLLLTFNFLQTHAMATATPFTMTLNSRRLEVLPIGFYLYDDENTLINMEAIVGKRGFAIARSAG